MKPDFKLLSITLGKVDSPFNHPFSNNPYRIFTLQKGDSPFLKDESPLSKGDSLFLKGESSFERLIHPSRRVIHPSKRVNGRVNRVNHPSNGEWGFARYTLAEVFNVQSTFLNPACLQQIEIVFFTHFIACFFNQKDFFYHSVYLHCRTPLNDWTLSCFNILLRFETLNIQLIVFACIITLNNFLKYTCSTQFVKSRNFDL